MTGRISVLLVEDDQPLRDSLADLLRLRGFDVSAVGDGLAFYAQLARARYTVLVVDLGLPDQAGEVLVDYARRNTSSAIVVITARDTIDTRVGSYQAGADLFLAKPIDGRELAAAVASLASRRGGAAEPRPRSAWTLRRRERLLVAPGGQSVELTPKECQLLELLGAAPDHAAPRGVLVQALYARDDESADRALETLVRRTRQTIAAATGGQVPILTQHGVGYAFTEDLHPE